MGSFEQAFSDTERAATSTLQSAAGLVSLAKQLQKAAKEGNIAAIKRVQNRFNTDLDALRQPMADAVEVTRDRTSALAEYFLVGTQDANFAYELLHAVPSLDLPRAPEREAPDNYHLGMLQGDAGEDYFEEPI